MPDLSLYDAYQAADQQVAAAQTALNDLIAARDVAKAALIASIPEGVKFAVVPNPSPTISHVAGELVVEHAPFLGDPYTVA